MCGCFFGLSLSDFLDVPVNFSSERFVMDFFYDAAFLFLTVYVLFNNRKNSDKYFQLVLWAAIVLIVMQCFVFPYENTVNGLKIFEFTEGAVVFALLIAFSLKLRNKSFGNKCMIAVVALEFIVAVENAVLPMASVTGDFQAVDIPLNHAAFFMRPVLFASIALSYQVWLDRRSADRGGISEPA